MKPYTGWLVAYADQVHTLVALGYPLKKVARLLYEQGIINPDVVVAADEECRVQKAAILTALNMGARYL